MEYSYYAVFEYSSEEEISSGIFAIGIYFPDFIGCTSCSDSVGHGLEMAKEVLVLRIEEEIADGKLLPNPSDKEELEKDLAQNERLFGITVQL